MASTSPFTPTRSAAAVARVADVRLDRGDRWGRIGGGSEPAPPPQAHAPVCPASSVPPPPPPDPALALDSVGNASPRGGRPRGLGVGGIAKQSLAPWGRVLGLAVKQGGE